MLHRGPQSAVSYDSCDTRPLLLTSPKATVIKSTIVLVPDHYISLSGNKIAKNIKNLSSNISKSSGVSQNVCNNNCIPLPIVLHTIELEYACPLRKGLTWKWHVNVHVNQIKQLHRHLWRWKVKQNFKNFINIFKKNKNTIHNRNTQEKDEERTYNVNVTNRQTPGNGRCGTKKRGKNFVSYKDSDLDNLHRQNSQNEGQRNRKSSSSSPPLVLDSFFDSCTALELDEASMAKQRIFIAHYLASLLSAESPCYRDCPHVLKFLQVSPHSFEFTENTNRPDGKTKINKNNDVKILLSNSFEIILPQNFSYFF